VITISNLTPKQKLLLDVMWNIENIDQVNEFINSLPKMDRIDAQSLLKIAIDESMEHEYGLKEYEGLAKAVIDKAGQR